MSITKTSTTAFVIADCLAKLSRQPRWKGHFSDEMARLNADFARHAKDTYVKRLIGCLPLPLFMRVMDFLYVPGMGYHYLFRKLFIEKQLHRGLMNGARQVIVLGAGLDTLAIRMAKNHATVGFFEIDLPHTQQTKIRILEQTNHAIPHNCIFKSADLSQASLESVLCEEKTFDRNLPTLIIIEGVLMYLTENEVRALFTSLRSLFADNLTVVFGAMAAPDNDGNLCLRITSSLLQRGGEATKWHCSSASMPAFLSGLGYRIRETITYKKLQNLYRGDMEIKAVPDEDENYYVVVNN